MPADPYLLAAIHPDPAVTPTTLRQLITADLARPGAAVSPLTLAAAGVPPDRIVPVQRALLTADPDRWRERLAALKVTVIALDDARYPAPLAEIASPPPLLYVRGSLTLLSQPSLAIVGTRRPSPYGVRQTERVASALGEQGVTIVSGLAYGIDAAAHRASTATSGHTVAVLGCGIDQVYPWDHRHLLDQILADGGTVVSEVPLGAEPERHHFPQRNRIIAGLTRATWLVEAPNRSGALITMKYALEANRDTYVLPGDVSRPQALGALHWLQLGAVPAWEAVHFRPSFPSLGDILTRPSPSQSFTADERIIIDRLTLDEPLHIDDISRACRLDPSAVASVISVLEIRGAVRHHGGMRYTRQS